MRMGWEGESEDPEEGGRHTKPPSRSAMLRALHSNSALETPWSLFWKGRVVPATIKKSVRPQAKNEENSPHTYEPRSWARHGHPLSCHMATLI